MQFLKRYPRQILLALLVLGVLCFYVYKLMQMQVVEGEQYSRKAAQGSSYSQVLKAARGEIVDRNGLPLAVNRIGYNVVINRAFMEGNSENEIILRLVELVRPTGDQWIDNLPLSQTAPYTFTEEASAMVDRLRKSLGLGVFATAEDCMHWLIQTYQLELYDPPTQRLLAGIRWEMTQRGFSLSLPYTFATDVSLQTVGIVSEHSFELPGIAVQEAAQRQYFTEDIAPHIIGRTGPLFSEEYADYKEKDSTYALDDIVGRGGVESAFESLLRGQNGKQRIVLDANGKVLQVQEETPQVPGNTLVLTLDKRLQEVALRALAQEIAYLNETAPSGMGKEADAGAAVAINVKTGEILAAVTYPTYHTSDYATNYQALSTDPTWPLYNRALQGLYAPGSTFKPCVSLAALSGGIISENSQVFCARQYTYYNDYQPTCLGYHGPRTVLTALQVSCNVFFYDVGRRTGIDRIAETAAQLGLGKPTGIEINESVGDISSPTSKELFSTEPWYPGDVLQSSIGQLYNRFTPLQLANYAATIANKGRRMKLTLVKSINNYGQDTILQENTPQVATTVWGSEVDYDSIIEGMKMASLPGGTCYSYLGPTPYAVASKTGTPQTREFPNSTFIAFAPADNPQIAVAIVIEKGWHGYTGAPVARKIFDAYLLNDYSILENQTPAEESQTEGEENQAGQQ